MSNIAKLTEQEIQEGMSRLNGWVIDEGKLYKEFVFEDFVNAFAFMTKAAFAVESLNHHPEWFNVYNRVRIHLTTHEAGGISARDLALAATLDTLF